MAGSSVGRGTRLLDPSRRFYYSRRKMASAGWLGVGVAASIGGLVRGPVQAAEEKKGTPVRDLSAYDDPDDKVKFELRPSEYPPLAKPVNGVVHQWRRLKDNVRRLRENLIYKKDVSIAHTLQLVEDVKDFANQPTRVARAALWLGTPMIVFIFKTPRGKAGLLARLRRAGWTSGAFILSSYACYPPQAWRATKATVTFLYEGLTPDPSTVKEAADDVVAAAHATKSGAHLVEDVAADVADAARAVEASPLVDAVPEVAEAANVVETTAESVEAVAKAVEAVAEDVEKAASEVADAVAVVDQRPETNESPPVFALSDVMDTSPPESAELLNFTANASAEDGESIVDAAEPDLTALVPPELPKEDSEDADLDSKLSEGSGETPESSKLEADDKSAMTPQEGGDAPTTAVEVPEKAYTSKNATPTPEPEVETPLNDVEEPEIKTAEEVSSLPPPRDDVAAPSDSVPDDQPSPPRMTATRSKEGLLIVRTEGDKDLEESGGDLGQSKPEDRDLYTTRTG